MTSLRLAQRRYRNAYPGYRNMRWRELRDEMLRQLKSENQGKQYDLFKGVA